MLLQLQSGHEIAKVKLKETPELISFEVKVNCTGAIIEAVCYFAAIFSPRAFATSRVGQMKIICREKKTKKKDKSVIVARVSLHQIKLAISRRLTHHHGFPLKIQARVANLPELHISLIQKTTGSWRQDIGKERGSRPQSNQNNSRSNFLLCHVAPGF